MSKRYTLLCALFSLWALDVAAQETKTVIAGERYENAPGGEWVLGADYRDLWSTAIEAEYLDLHNFAGGLTPTGIGKGLQSLGLRFVGADGRPYTFRPLKKSLLDLLPEYLHDTFFEDIVACPLSSPNIS